MKHNSGIPKQITVKTTTSATTKTTTNTTDTTDTTDTTSTSINITDLALKAPVQIYMESVFRRLNNFERLMNVKMDKFNEKITSVNGKPRLVFLMTYEELVKMYVDRQKKKQKMKHITSGFKLTATIALLSLCLFLVYALYSFKVVNELMKQRSKRIYSHLTMLRNARKWP